MGTNQSRDLKNAGTWPQIGGSLSYDLWWKMGGLSESESRSIMSDSLWLQASILEWVAFPFSRGSSQPRDWTQVSRIAGRFSTSWAAREAQDYWSEEPILPDPGIDPGSPALQANSLPTEPPGKSKNAGVVSTSWQILLEDINSKLKVIILHL